MYPDVLSAYAATESTTPTWCSGREALAAVEATVRELFNLESIVVLTGLGTSIGLVSEQGAKAPTMADLWDTVSAVEGFSAITTAFEMADPVEKGLEELLSRVRSAQELQSLPVFQAELPDLARFVKSAEAAITEACSFVDTTTELTEHVSLLRTLAARSQREASAQLFTTNYDLAFDRAADRAGVTLVDGFGLGTPRRYDPEFLRYELAIRGDDGRLSPAPRVVRYGKLHGSVDWHRERDESVIKVDQPANPVLIYPRRTKFADSYQSPYLDGMARFQTALRARSVGVLVIGFGFSDAHLTEPIRHAVLANPGLRLIAWAPDLRKRVEQGYDPALTTIARLAERGDRRLTIVGDTFARLTSMLPQTPSDDPVEEHLARRRSLASNP
jgi:SIR2-like domain